jgi:hypothetical protein
MFGKPKQLRRREFAKAIDGQLPTPLQKELIGAMLLDVFVTIRNTQDLQLAKTLADAFHNLPLYVHLPQFKWSVMLMFLEGRLGYWYPKLAEPYIAKFDEIVGFESGAK